jgi:hypothetical protein
MTLTTASGRVDNIRRSLVCLKMPRALEMLDATLRRIDRARSIASRPSTTCSPKSSACVRAAASRLRCAWPDSRSSRRSPASTSPSSLRSIAIASWPWPASTSSIGPRSSICSAARHGESHLAAALAVEAVRAGRSVNFIPLADLIAALAKAEREGTLR